MDIEQSDGNITDPVAQETQRRVLEARARLREGYTTGVAVDALMARVRKYRGDAAAQALREEMRRQWRCRADWLDAKNVHNGSTSPH